MSEKPSRQRIINLLKKSEWMTVADLSQEVGITPMAVRQHLMALEKQGIVSYSVKKAGIGRPVFQYQLTERAEKIFPKSYGKFLNELLCIIEELDGREKLDSIFRLRNEHLKANTFSAITELPNLANKVSTLAEILNQDGFMAELEVKPRGYLLKQFNCPLSEVMSKFVEPCRYELALYCDLLGMEVQRKECIREGDKSCSYFIPA